jgi:hypothetical protein
MLLFVIKYNYRLECGSGWRCYSELACVSAVLFASSDKPVI